MPFTKGMWRDLRGAPGIQTQRGVCVVAGLLVTTMAVVCWLFAITAPGDQDNVSGGLTAFLIFLAAGAVGAALGFLFGLPRARLAEELAAAANTSAAGTKGSTPPTTTRFLANSNLIKVSDWATTIIIGLGLASLGSIIPAASDLATAMQEPLGGGTSAGALGLSMVVIGATSSLILTYLWTSLRLRELMNAAESETTESDRLDLEKRRTELARQQEELTKKQLEQLVQGQMELKHAQDAFKKQQREHQTQIRQQQHQLDIERKTIKTVHA
jgi:hypothetical protein